MKCFDKQILRSGLYKQMTKVGLYEKTPDFE